jgi:hypothetical protein
MKMPDGKMFTTPGLSMTYIKNIQQSESNFPWLIIDTAGVMQPISFMQSRKKVKTMFESGLIAKTFVHEQCANKYKDLTADCAYDPLWKLTITNRSHTDKNYTVGTVQEDGEINWDFTLIQELECFEQPDESEFKEKYAKFVKTKTSMGIERKDEETAVYTRLLESAENAEYVDRSQTETITLELMTRMADVMLFVVNEFTWAEQLMLFHYRSSIKERIEKNSASALGVGGVGFFDKMFIVHNLQMIDNEQTAARHFQEQVQNNTVGAASQEKTKGNALVFIEERHVMGTPKSYLHFGVFKDGSPAAKAYNKDGFDRIKSYMEFLGSRLNPHSLREKLETEMKEILSSIVNVVGARENVKSDRGREADTSLPKHKIREHMLVNYEKGSEFNDRVYGRITIAAKTGKIEPKVEGVVNDFGQLQLVETRFNPTEQSQVQITPQEGGIKQWVWMLEIAGVKKEDIKYKCNCKEGIYVCFTIKRKPIPDWSVNAKVVSNSRINRKSGTVEINPKIPDDFKVDCNDDDGKQHLWDGDKPSLKYENGILYLYAVKND